MDDLYIQQVMKEKTYDMPNYNNELVGKCADPCGTAIQGQHAIKPQQAADTLSPSKNQFNIEESP